MTYESLPGFQDVLLEESYVLDVIARPGRVDIPIDLVVLPGHPSYQEPVPAEQICYVRALICFEGVTELMWLDQGRKPAIDATGETDFGSVDLIDVSGDEWRFVGDWGDLRLRARHCQLVVGE